MTAASPLSTSDRIWRFSIAIALALSLIVLIILSLHVLDRVDSNRQHLQALDSRLSELSVEVKQARNAADQARRKAVEAEEFSRVAAQGRERAESSRAEYARRALEAQQEASEARQSASLAREELLRLREQRDAEMNRLQRALNKIAETRRTALGVVMNLGSDTIKFDFDKATLRPENREILSRIAGVLLTSGGYRVQIYGHTDNIGTGEYNQLLSERRAETVKRYLVQAGIDTDIIETKGFGKSNPLVYGTNPEARAKNRRVEIGIIDTVISYKGPVTTDAQSKTN